LIASSLKGELSRVLHSVQISETLPDFSDLKEFFSEDYLKSINNNLFITRRANGKI